MPRYSNRSIRGKTNSNPSLFTGYNTSDDVDESLDVIESEEFLISSIQNEKTMDGPSSASNLISHLNTNKEDETSIDDIPMRCLDYNFDVCVNVHDHRLMDSCGEIGKYTGVILASTGKPHGLGRMVYDTDGMIYDGKWRHGHFHGCGKANFANGDSFEGEYHYNQRHGRGKYEWTDGRVYVGEFQNDQRHGTGTFTWPDGAMYVGDFQKGQREGKGRYSFPHGGFYDGYWEHGKYHGYGGKFHVKRWKVKCCLQSLIHVCSATLKSHFRMSLG
jgi:hypothetical protein